MKADRAETLRYLGYRGQEIDSQTQELLEKVSAKLEQNSAPRSVYREYDCRVTDSTVSIGGLTITSRNLAGNLRGCEKAVLLAATIGRTADLMIRQYSVTNLAGAVIVQAAGAACMESYVDEVEDSIRQEAEKRGLYLRPRFSPGYGDFSLEYQKDIFAMLECEKRVGITLTQENLMLPSKSVTAIIGLTAKERESCHRADCSQCGKTDCEFRRTSENKTEENIVSQGDSTVPDNGKKDGGKP